MLSKSLNRRFTKLKRSYEKLRFNWLLHQKTKACRKEILRDAEAALLSKKIFESEDAYAKSSDPLVQQGHNLKQEVCQSFKNKLNGSLSDRILIQVPSAESSPAGYSLFSNLIESLQFIGVPCQALQWDEDSQTIIDQFQPTVFLSSDHHTYLERINWTHLQAYKKIRPLKVGLTASLAEYDNSPLKERLEYAKQIGVDFFYSFRDIDYIHSKVEYQPFFNDGYSILTIPFGANILHYYPVPGIKKDLSFALMASRKREHIRYLMNIASRYFGFIDGPGWNHIKNFEFNRTRDRYIYARAKVGLNVHLPEQLEWACELNERTYQLAACGIPQLIDNPMLLNKVFNEEMIFSANNPRHYSQLFEFILSNPEIAEKKALKAQQEVFARHTTFHRAESFIEQLKVLKK